MDKLSIDLLGVADTKLWLGQLQDCSYTYIPLYETPPRDGANHTYRGLGLIAKDPDSVKVLEANKYNAWVVVQPDDGDVLIHLAYWPSVQDRDDIAEAQANFLETQMRLSPNYPFHISGGDFNARMKAASDPVSNTQGDELKDIMLQCELGHAELDHGLLTEGAFTRVQTLTIDGKSVTQKSSPDHVFLNFDLAAKCSSFVVTDDQLESDHCFLISRLTISPSPRKLPDAKTKPYLYNSEGDLEAMEAHLNGIDWSAALDMCTSEQIAFHATTVNDIASEILKKPSGFKPKPRFDDELKIAYSEMRKWQAAAKKSQRQDDFQYAREAQSLFARLNRKRVASVNNDVYKELERLHKDTSKFWIWANKLRKLPGSSTPPMMKVDGVELTGDALDQAWMDYFHKLGEEEECSVDHDPEEFRFSERFRQFISADLAEMEKATCSGEDFMLNKRITREELIGQIKKWDNRKAAGFNLVAPDFIKAGCGPLMRWDASKDNDTPFEDVVCPYADFLVSVLNKILDTAEWPHSWRKGIIKLLYKKYEKFLMKNYRGITLLTATSKLFTGILASRLLEVSETRNWIAEEQGGFRPLRGSTDQVFTLRSILVDRKARNLNSIVCFLDLVKAYDKIWKDGLLYKLKKLAVSGKIYGVMKANLKKFLRKIENMSEEERNYFLVVLGVAQGAPESCMLFNIFINDLIELLRERNCGVIVKRVKRPGLWFADDTTLIAATVRELQRALSIVDEWCEKWRMRMNKSPKSGILVFNCPGSAQLRRDIDAANLTCTAQPLYSCDFYKYLGVFMEPDLKFSKHVLEMVAKASRVSKFLLWITRRGRGLRPRSALYLWNSICRPLLEFGCEVWGPVITNAQRNSLEGVQTSFLQSLLETPHGISSQFLRLEMGIEPLQSRWDKLVSGFIKRATLNPDRLLWISMEMIMEVRVGIQPDRWAVDVRRMVDSVYEGERPIHNAEYCNPDFLKGIAKRIDAKFAETAEDNALALPSLNRYANHIRCWEDTKSEYAWAQMHVGRAGHRFLEPYLDDWNHKALCKLKMRFRAGCDFLNWRASRIFNEGLHNGFCPACWPDAPETPLHFFLQCEDYHAERLRLLSDVERALGRLDPVLARNGINPVSFGNLDDEFKLHWILGKRTGSRSVDRSIDRACKIFIRDGFRRRDAAVERICALDDIQD